MRNRPVSVAIVSSAVWVTAILITGCSSQSSGGGSGDKGMMDVQLLQLENEIDLFTTQMQAAKVQDQGIGTNSSSMIATANCIKTIPEMGQRLQAIAGSVSGNTKLERVRDKLRYLYSLSGCSS
jgi:hypothetical protein